MLEILLAEDNPADVYLIREALREHGVDCAVRVASDGAEVLRMISSEPGLTEARAPGPDHTGPEPAAARWNRDSAAAPGDRGVGPRSGGGSDLVRLAAGPPGGQPVWRRVLSAKAIQFGAVSRPGSDIQGFVGTEESEAGGVNEIEDRSGERGSAMQSEMVTDALDTSTLLKTLIAFKDGDFSVRLPVTRPGWRARSPTRSTTSSS